MAGQWNAERSDPSLEIPVEVSNKDALPATDTNGEQPLVRLGRYDLLGRMAVGGMAEIYLARERSAAGGSRDLVVKIVRPQYAGDASFDEMFLNEGRVALGLKHPNICHVYEFGIERGHYFIAMEYVHGATLQEVLRRCGRADDRIPTAVAVRIVASIAEALDAAHRTHHSNGQRGVVHGDVSPQNIMIGYDGVVKLLDFGVAQVQSDRTESGSGVIKGKFGYLSPEQCLGKRIDGRSDVFSLGICLWEALTGQRLFKRDGEYETLRAVVNERAPDPREYGVGVPEDLAEVLHKALAKNPEDRFQTAGDMDRDLSQFLLDRRELVNAGRISDFMSELFADDIESGPRLVRSPSIPIRLGSPEPAEPADSGAATERQPPPRGGRNKRTGFVALAFGAAAMILGGLVWWWTSDGDSPSPAPADASSAAAPSPAGSAHGSSSKDRDEAPATGGDREGEPANGTDEPEQDPEGGAEVSEQASAADEADEAGDKERRATPEARSRDDAKRDRRRQKRREAQQRTEQGFLAEPDF